MAVTYTRPKWEASFTISLTAPVAARLRAFLQRSYCGNDRVLFKEVYSPLLRALQDQGVDDLCTNEMLDDEEFQDPLPYPPTLTHT